MSDAPMSRFATGRWKAIYGSLSDPEIAIALRGWTNWRMEQIAQHPDVAVQIAEIFDGATKWLREEAQRRLTPKPSGPWVTTADLVARYGDRLHQTGDRWRTPCPWHEDARPSLVIYADGWCHCFACNEHRPVADLAWAWEVEVAA